VIEERELIAVSADWILPIATPPIQNGWIVIRNGTIEFVGSQLPTLFQSACRYQLPGYAILPGLINAHCHLEFSDLSQPIPAGKSFSAWISGLLAYRRLQSHGRQNPDADEVANLRRSAWEAGIRESYCAGVRWVVDMTTKPWDRTWVDATVKQMLHEMRPAYVPNAAFVMQPCMEILDVSESRLQETMAFAEEQLVAPEAEFVGKAGFSPHAPYTTSLSTTKNCVEQSIANSRLMSMHLAESADEIEWLENHSGGFAELLGPILGEGYFEKLGQISDHLETLATAPRSIIAHGNFLSDSDLQVLASRSQTMAIAHCPRTHRHFGHWHGECQQYPLAERLSLGVRHLLGTDSRASNPDLNLWSEAQQIREMHPSVPSEWILKMVTYNAASFLGIGVRYGSVRSGVSALLTAVKLANVDTFQKIQSAEGAYDLVLKPGAASAPLELVLAKVAPSRSDPL
jgi:aminodeoxyfutalosine deaminase